MAIFYPEFPWHFNNSCGEREVFEALQTLDDSFTILHSLHWLNSQGPRRLEAALPVQGEADFVILQPKGILVLEVKSGGIVCEKQEWKQINTSTGKEIPITDPVDQANRSAHYIRKKIEASLPELKHVGVFHAVWFPSVPLERNILPLNYDSAIILNKAALRAPAAAIDRAFQFWLPKFDWKCSISGAEWDAILNLLAPSFRLLPTLKLTMLSRERQFVRLTSEQALVLDYLDEQQHALINGPAGSGKTILAYQLAHRMAANREEVLFLCSPKMLRKHLNGVARKRAKAQSQTRRVSFSIPQGYAMEYFDSVVHPGNESRYPEKSGKTAEEMVLKALHEGRLKIPNVVIDEGQDFTDAWIEGLRKCTTGKFIVFYDKNQALFQAELPSWFQRAECRLVLRKICRNTREIATTAFRLVGASAIDVHAPKGAKPKLHVYSKRGDGRAILQKLLADYLSNGQTGIQPHDIAVLTMGTENTAEFISCKWPALQSDEYDSPTICFTSTAKFKGLERRIVIVIDVDLGRISDKKYRGFLHQGCTRATNELHIIAFTRGTADLRKCLEALGGQTTASPSVDRLADLLAVDLVTESVFSPAL